jgi:anti-anti-sigma factor
MPHMRVHQHGLAIVIATQIETVVVFLEGELDELSMPLLANTLQGLSGQRFESLWVNLAGLTAIDGSGIDALLEARLRTRAQGREFQIRSPSHEVAQMLEQRADCAVLLS